MSTPENPTPPPWTPPAYPGPQAPPQRGNGLAITAIVLSSLALIGVLAAFAFGALMFFAGGAGGFDTYTLSGRVEAAGGRVTHADLTSAVRETIEDDDWDVEELDCPEGAKVGSGLSVMCDATLDGLGWVALVVFDNEQGDFTMLLY